MDVAELCPALLRVLTVLLSFWGKEDKNGSSRAFGQRWENTVLVFGRQSLDSQNGKLLVTKRPGDITLLAVRFRINESTEDTW